MYMYSYLLIYTGAAQLIWRASSEKNQFFFFKSHVINHLDLCYKPSSEVSYATDGFFFW